MVVTDLRGVGERLKELMSSSALVSVCKLGALRFWVVQL